MLLGLLLLVIASAAVTVILIESRTNTSQSPSSLSGAPPGGSALVSGQAKVRLVKVAGKFPELTDIQFMPTTPPELVTLEKRGLAKRAVFDRSQAEITPIENANELFSVHVNSSSEMGLLGLAFHPDFATNGRFFVHYNPAGAGLRTRISEWSVDPKNGERALAHEVRTVIELEQPYGNHKGGQIAFGPDRMLYIGLGDGGAGGDPHQHGQNLRSLLGKILRVDVEHATNEHPYAIPADNPFRGRNEAREEIWAYGLRNPWRFSFDGKGRLVVADVGQNAWEEVDILSRGDNAGWNTREGKHCYGSDTCSAAGMVDPVWEYGHSMGASITGGYSYTGTHARALQGTWLCGDFVFRKLWALTLPNDASSSASAVFLGTSALMVSTFGRSPDGEVYVGDFATGNIYGFADIEP